NTAVHLDALLGNIFASAVDDELSCGQLGAALGAIFIVSQAGSQNGHGSSPLQLADHVNHAVLQNLELTDRRAELLTGLQVVQGQVAGNAHSTNGFAAQSSNSAAG